MVLLDFLQLIFETQAETTWRIIDEVDNFMRQIHSQNEQGQQRTTSCGHSRFGWVACATELMDFSGRLWRPRQLPRRLMSNNHRRLLLLRRREPRWHVEGVDLRALAHRHLQKHPISQIGIPTIRILIVVNFERTICLIDCHRLTFFFYYLCDCHFLVATIVFCNF